MKNAMVIKQYIKNILYYTNKIQEAIKEETDIVCSPPSEEQIVDENTERILINTLMAIDSNSEQARYLLVDLTNSEIKRFEDLESKHFVTITKEVLNDNK